MDLNIIITDHTDHVRIDSFCIAGAPHTWQRAVITKADYANASTPQPPYLDWLEHHIQTAVSQSLTAHLTSAKQAVAALDKHLQRIAADPATVAADPRLQTAPPGHPDHVSGLPDPTSSPKDEDSK